MLTNIPQAVNRMARNVVRSHPNTYNCQVFRKSVTREAGQGEEMVGGLPTLGGLGVLDSEDEERFDYAFLGNGYALPADGFAPSPMVNHGDATLSPGAEYRFLIEPEEPSGHPDWFDVRSHDVVYLLLGPGPDAARLAFEVINIEAVSNIPPHSIRYITNRRDDLHIPSAAP